MKDSKGIQSSFSVTCSKLPSDFIADKQATKKFFEQEFGEVKNFISKPSRQECTVEFKTLEAAQKALASKVNFTISPTTKVTEEYIDPEVQAELESMLPVGGKTANVKQSKFVSLLFLLYLRLIHYFDTLSAIENFIKNPPQMLFSKSKLFSVPPKQKTITEPISINADQGQIQMAKSELENLARKPARTLEEK